MLKLNTQNLLCISVTAKSMTKKPSDVLSAGLLLKVTKAVRKHNGSYKCTVFLSGDFNMS